jgi:TolB-like protein/Flp pilus assembly protein TadD
MSHHVDRRIVLRIGINVGDIIIDGDDIFGDGVNVAARLEALCEPGGVCISRSANDQVRDKLRLAFADLGEQTVKNIARAVGVFGLAAKDIAALPEEVLPQPEPPESPKPHVPTPRGRAGAMVAGTVVLAAILATGGWWGLRDRTARPVTAAVAPAAPRPAPHSPRDRRQSVIVLPFENSSGDPAQDGIAAGFTRDVTDAVAGDTSMPLVPSATAASYRGKALDLRAIGRDHDVHFALTGNVHRQDGHLIVVATLYETADVQPISSPRFDRPDRPDEVNVMIRLISDAIRQATTDAEVARAMREHPDSLDKRDLMLAASATPLQQISKENLLAKLALIERALALDPNYLWALQQEARVRSLLVLNGFASAAELNEAVKAADRALMLAPNDVETLRGKATVLRAQGDLDAAAAVLRRVIELRPLWGYRYNDLGSILLTQGHVREALENFTTARRFATPTDAINFIDTNIAVAMLANDRFPEAIAQARLAITEFPPEAGRGAEIPWLTLIAAESANGQDTEARADLQKFLAIPRTLHTVAEIQKARLPAAVPKLLEGLRRAGMPEE